MNRSPAPLAALSRLHSVVAALALFASDALAVGQTVTGRITGLVTNSDATVFLEGATVTIDGTTQATFTDRRGEFDFGAITPGEHTIRLSYTGMSIATVRTTVEPGRTASVTVALREDVVKMGTFSVTADRNADGASSLERMAVEQSLADLTRRFKAIPGSRSRPAGAQAPSGLSPRA